MSRPRASRTGPGGERARGGAGERAAGETPGRSAPAIGPEARGGLLRAGRLRVGALAVAGVVTAALPLYLDRAQLTVYILLGLYAVVATGVSLLMGYAGQVSLGQMAFYAVGAYTAAVMSLHGLPPLLGLAAAPVCAFVVATIVGIPLLRLRGHYLAFATLAFLLIFVAVAGQQDFLGGAIGLQDIPPLGVGSLKFVSFRSYAWVTWFAVVLVMLVSHNIIDSRPGRGLRALATSEVAAESSGVDVGRYKLFVFGLSAAFAGLAGAIYAFFIASISPAVFSVQLSLQFVVIAVVGGLGTITGPVVGSAIVTLLVQGLNDLATRPGMPEHAAVVSNYAAYAVLLIIIVLAMPGGVVPTAGALVRRRLRPPRPATRAVRP
jgi:branched-chain amino acid transport system permease protein